MTTTTQTEEWYLQHVCPYLGIPCNIFSDKEFHFLSIFKKIWVLLGLSTTFHPQTKVVNRVWVHAPHNHFGRNKQLDNYLQILQQQLEQRPTTVVAVVKAAQDHGKQRYEKQRTSISFQPGDRAWVHLDHKHFKGHHHTLLPIRHGPYTILQKMAENAQRLYIPPQ